MDVTPLKRIWPNDDHDYMLVVYTGHGKPAAVMTCPGEVEYIVRPFLGMPRPSAACWMVSEVK